MMYFLEVGTGIATGVILYLLWQGVNILPVLFVLGLIAASVYMGVNRPGGKSFAVVGGRGSEERLIDFEDIGGQEVAKKELREALDFIKDVERIKSLGIRPIKGILLSGPPGTGKTLLAKAAAKYMDSVFIAASGSEFVEMYVGVGAQRVRQLFKQARTLAMRQGKTSAVIFIDEIEVLGGKRGQHHGHLEYDQTLNELLVQMDGLSSDDDVRLLVIGATNRLDILDPALLRPGRFDRQVKVDLPDKTGRLHILQLHTRNKPLAEDVSLDEIARDTFGFSGAHLESVANEAAIIALREGAAQITREHLRAAVDKVIMGEKLDRLPSAAEKRRIAVHEAGHAIVSEFIEPGSVAGVNVASRGNALGYVRQTQQDDMYLYTADYLRGRIAVALAGAVAEELEFGNRSTGAGNDFKQAADLAKQIIFGGMSELGIVSPEDIPKEKLHNAITAILSDVETGVRAILRDQKAALDRVVTALLQRESIAGDELRAMLGEAGYSQCA
ncbi:AAA family ATPase [Thermosinus carboxydivorans]|nr:AAA family ATPase [Thermosinus carboxydivorans]